MSDEKKGELLIWAEALLWSMFPIITKFTTSSIDPLISLTVTTSFSLLLFLGVTLYKKKLYELKSGQAVKDSLKAGILISLIFYGLTFYGINKTGAGSASIILQLEIVTGFLFFNLLKKEYIKKSYIYGCLCMLVGGVLVLSPNINGFRLGDILIILAVCVTPLGNFYQRRASRSISVEAVLLIRSLVAVLVLWLVSLSIHGVEAFQFSAKELFWLACNGIFIFGFSKILWLLGIQKISVTKAHAMNIISPVITVFIAFVWLKEHITTLQFVSLVPVSLGVYLLTRSVGENKVQ
jgi:drug/metabolite transporter (DMT)-like permease